MTSPGRLDRLLHPESIAVIGGDAAAAVVEQCRSLGYEGELWAVNPNRSSVAGVPAVTTVERLPAAPDAAFVGVNGPATVEVVAALARLGAGGAVCYASGFAELNDRGEKLQDKLLEAAAGMPLLGPNCYGLINAADGFALWPDEQGCVPVDRGVAIVTQSGNMALNLTMQRRGLELTHVVAVGNQADIALEDVVAALLDDHRVKAIGLHIEGLHDARAFGRVALAAAAAGVPIVAMKTGATAAAARIARSHTASMSGPDGAYDALFSRYRVPRARTMEELLATLGVLATLGPLPGRRLASLSCSGGEAALVADLAARHEIDVPAMTAGHRTAVAATLPDIVAVDNPLDYHTFIWGDRQALTRTFTSMLAGPFDVGLLVLDFPTNAPPGDTSWWPTAEAIVAACEATGVPVVVASSLAETMPVEAVAWFREHGVAAVHGLDNALAAIGAAASSTGVDASAIHDAAPVVLETEELDEPEAKALLALAGVTVPRGVAGSDAGKAATELGFPVVVKALGHAHKTERRAVATGLADADAVDRAVAAMPPAKRYLVEEQANTPVAELVIGVRAEPLVGWVLTLGRGGTLVELEQDVRQLLLPTTSAAIRVAVDSLRIAPLLHGYRGGPAGDIDAVADAVMRIARLAVDERLVEIEVNPMFVAPTGSGVVAVDAYARRAVDG